VLVALLLLEVRTVLVVGTEVVGQQEAGVVLVVEMKAVVVVVGWGGCNASVVLGYVRNFFYYVPFSPSSLTCEQHRISYDRIVAVVSKYIGTI
jgi:hypothetical protein